MRGDKPFRKRLDKHCIFCKEGDETVLDVHRIDEGCNGGDYSMQNTVRLCSNCHRRVHHGGDIKITGWVTSSKGRLLEYYLDGELNYVSPSK